MRSIAPGRCIAGGGTRFGIALVVLAASISVGSPIAHHRPTVAEARSAGSTGWVAGYATPPPKPLHWQPLPAAAGAFLPLELVIARIGVEARVEDKGVDNRNVMESPDRPFDVAWYHFTAKPGSGSNAVFSGHRDYWGVGPAIFWRLGEVTAGDVIDVVSGQLTEARYEVTQTASYALSSIPMQSVLAPGKEDQITLITCWGAFKGGAYDHRLIVRATRLA